MNFLDKINLENLLSNTPLLSVIPETLMLRGASRSGGSGTGSNSGYFSPYEEHVSFASYLGFVKVR